MTGRGFLLYTIDMSTHQSYLAQSPYYRSILATEGRYADAATVQRILSEHSLVLSDYLDDSGLDALPEETDVLDLVQWLGY